MLKKIWKFLKKIVWGKDLVVYRLRKYLRKLYDGYPTHAFYGYEITNEIVEGIQNLKDDKVIKFIGTDENGKDNYRLTAEGLRLVEIWNTEKLTLWVLLILLIEIFIIINLP